MDNLIFVSVEGFFFLIMTKGIYIGMYVCVCVCVCSLVVWVLRHINPCRLFNVKSIFMKIVQFQTVQFSISTQFKCDKNSYFQLFSLVKQFYS